MVDLITNKLIYYIENRNNKIKTMTDELNKLGYDICKDCNRVRQLTAISNKFNCNNCGKNISCKFTKHFIHINSCKENKCFNCNTFFCNDCKQTELCKCFIGYLYHCKQCVDNGSYRTYLQSCGFLFDGYPCASANTYDEIQRSDGHQCKFGANIAKWYNNQKNK
tara:strand:+ start:4111 stop:4605 length:495 start_codon:yes stop_codon:yes gene_type:complete